MAAPSYPVRVEADLDPRISRWLWLVKWFLAIPHFIVLVFLWIAFVVVSAIAFFAIAFTGRYPAGLFRFNVGVLRWSWRVHFYTFGALATDRYPPFTLAEVPSYPAHLEVAYPEHLSRGLVWVKWWLLAIPQYLIVAVFIGGGTWAAWQFGNSNFSWAPGGLVGLLVLFAAVVLLVTGRYPQQIFDLVLGLNRWVLRVAAYAALMTDDYPPFRLDLGGHEPGHILTVPPPDTPPGGQPEPEWGAPPQPVRRRGWTGWRVASVVVGSLLLLISLGLLAGGGVATWADNTQRDASGYLTTGAHSFTTTSYALTSDGIHLFSSGDLFAPSDYLGTVRVRVTPVSANQPVFVGIGSQSAVNRYLAGVSHEVVTNWPEGRTAYHVQTGAQPAVAPTSVSIWAVQSTGTGTRTLRWRPSSGSWTVVVMNADASRGLSVNADVGATVPDLGWLAVGLLAAGGLLLLIAGALIVVPVARASRS
jgi:hypothetical protein